MPKFLRIDFCFFRYFRLLGTHAELAAAVLLVVEVVLLQQLVATLLKPALTPILGPEFTLNVER
jgi:hypothetical protein